MTPEEKLRKLLEDFVKGYINIQVQPAKVISVDLTEETCNVEFLDEDLAPHNEVHLTAGIGVGTGMLLEPEINSVVYVGIVNNDPQWAFVALFTKLKSIKLRGDQFGGLVKVADNVTRLNNIEKDLNSLKTAFKNWSPVSQDGGAALKTIAANWFGTNLELTKKSHIENTEVKHG